MTPPRTEARSIHDVVRQVCLWLPETDEVSSHGFPNFRVRGKTFASYVVNHHGDGRVALWLNAPPGALEHHVGMEPRIYFVPPYVGPRGWLGVRLDRGLNWARIAHLVREAYEKVAPAALSSMLPKTPRVLAPTQRLTASDIDPMRSTQGAALVKTLRRICLALPETNESVQFGFPVWRANMKTFALARSADARLSAYFWVGTLQQGMLVEDPRLSIPAYMGHNGWIALDVSSACDRAELAAFALQSYRHFALKRMLLALDRGTVAAPSRLR